MSFNLDHFWNTERDQHMDAAQKTFELLKPQFEKLLNACVTSIQNGGKILFFGNGGSAADAQHLATELSIRYAKDRKPIAGLALTTDTSAITAAGNDMGFEKIFARQIDALGKKGDVAIGISTSGTSANIIAGLKAAKTAGLITAGLSGRKGGDMVSNCDILLIVPSETTARIQEMHITLGQMLCGALEQKLGLIQ
mgnify:CR=1 FL=1